MSEHKKELEPYKSGNKQVQGKYHFKIPESLGLGTYPMEIEYESTDESKPDAYQYNGFVVIGHRAYLKTSPVIIPFNTNATEEALIPLADKLNTTFNGIVEASDDLTNEINKLPIHIQFVKGEFKDYHAPNVNYTKTLFSDFDNSYKSLTLPLPVETNATGEATKQIKVSDIYTEDEQITDLNTMLFKCKGTLNWGENNYVPVIVEAPLIIGTTTVWLQNVPTNTRTLEIENENLTVATTCGRGKLELDCEFYYRAFMRSDTQNNRMKYGYEDYRTDPDKMVKVGSVVLQYYHNNQWNTVPANQLEAVDSHTTINSDGSIKQTSGSETGKIKIYWTNTFATNTRTNIKYRWVYTGKVGATYGGLSASYHLAIAPEYSTPAALETVITFNNLTNNVWNTKRIGTLSGTVKDENNNNVNGTLSCADFSIPVTNGTFSKQIDLTATKFDDVTTTSFNVKFTPSSDGALESTKTLNVSFNPFDVTITLPSADVHVYDVPNNVASSDTLTVSIKDELGNNVNAGHLDLKLVPSAYNSTEYIVWNTDITSRNEWTPNGYGSLNYTDLFTALKSANLLHFTDYTIKATYTCSNKKYVSSKSTTGTGKLKYKCKYPTVKLITDSEFIEGTSVNFTPTTDTLSLSSEDLGNGFITRNIKVADSVQMKLQVFDSNNQRVGGIKLSNWFESKSKEVTIYKYSTDGTPVLSNGEPVEDTSYFQYEKNGQSVNSSVHVSPAYKAYPITMPYFTSTNGSKMSYTSDTKYNWKWYDDQLINQKDFYMDIVLDKYPNLFENLNPSVVHPYQSMENGVTSSHSFVTPVTKQASLILRLNMDIYTARVAIIPMTTTDGFTKAALTEWYSSTDNCNTHLTWDNNKCLYTICQKRLDDGYVDNEGLHAPNGVIYVNNEIKTTANCTVSFKVKFVPNNMDAPLGKFGGHFGLTEPRSNYDNYYGYGYLVERAPARYEFNRVNDVCNGYTIQNGERGSVTGVTAFQPNRWYTMQFIINNGIITAHVDELNVNLKLQDSAIPNGLYPYMTSFIDDAEIVMREIKVDYR